MLSLVGIAIVAAGFAARLNPLLVAVAAAFGTGLAAGMGVLEIVAAFGRLFNTNRYICLVYLFLPLIGLLERLGIQVQAQRLIGGLKAATVGRTYLVFFVLRQVLAALGAKDLSGHAQMVRPVLAPMGEAVAEETLGRPLAPAERTLVRAHAAAAENIALFFSEDIFVAIGSVILIKGYLAANGIEVSPLDVSVWAIPTALVAVVIHGARLLLLDRRLKAAKGVVAS
ncbi:DUF969 domain-containing protein [Nitrospirillum sp. BR 11163]|uniref:DUF969 domain-containing protein n=1 Tax=Nitrospirillum sp. BR 11163 TaxID=3104323 RepID=UPI002AFE4965|nr:DUF969 family protein [Nitrospirillum sp. BR 11163]MEA1672478.1 DUF969 family protein [Nitrospirillum sp. BR 11163]